MKKTKKHYSGQEKVQILRKHLIEKVAVSERCDQYGLHPSVFYRWQKEFFENGAAAFERPAAENRPWERRVNQLEEKLERKNEVLSELMEEHVRLKKSLGEI